MKFSNICPICLRTDRKLKVIPTTLSEYHDELTGFTLPLGDFNYCNDCECLLKKTYNFKQKCANAANILSIWKNTNEKEVTPAIQFHKNMSPICLDIWSSKNSKVFEYICADNKDPIVKEECVSEKLGILKELNMSDEHNRNGTKYEDIESIIKIEEISDKESKHKQDQITRGLGTPFQNFNNGLKNTMNLLQNIPTDNINNTIPNTGKSGKTKIQDSTIKYPKKKIVNVTKHVLNTPLQNFSIGLKDTNNLLQNIPTHNTIQNMGKTGKTKTEDSTITLPKKKIVNVRKHVLDTPFQNLNNDSEDTISQKMLTQNNNSIPNMESSGKIRTEKSTIKLPEKEIINGTNHENNTSVNQSESQVTARKSYIELDIDDIKNHINNIKKKSVMNDIDLDLLCINDDDLLEDMITMNDENESVTEFYNGLGPKERLIMELRHWTELQTKDGVVFDKEMIINSLDMFSDRFMERLTSLLHGKPCLQSRAVKLLTMIRERQQFTPYESVFDIEYMLTEKDKLEEFERRKTYECYVNAEFKCEICYQGFKAEKFLEYHKKAHHDPERTFTCHICHIRSYSTRKHHTHNVVFKCKLCPLVTYYRSSMVNHYEQHKGTTYKCDKCEKISKSKSAYMSHLSRVHPNTDSVCTICGYAFVSRHGLLAHMQLKHRDAPQVPAEDGPSYRCDKCVFTFSSEAACRTHQRRIHGQREIRTYSNTAKHREYRALKSSFALSCPECKTTGRGYGWLQKHYRLEHPSLDIRENFEHNKRYLCETCGKKFSKSTYLQQHMDFHLGVGIPCPICGKKFVNKEKLKLHQEFHYPPSYCCEHCGKRFYSAANLFSHRRIHIGDRRFKCHICGKGFLHRASVNEHIRGVHNQIRRVKKRRVTGKLSTKNSSKFDMKRRRRVTDTSNGATDTLIGVTDTSDEVTDISDEVTDAIIVVKDTSNGFTETSNDVTDTHAIEVFEIGAEVILS